MSGDDVLIEGVSGADDCSARALVFVDHVKIDDDVVLFQRAGVSKDIRWWRWRRAPGASRAQ